MHCYRSPIKLPAWFEEGLADYVAERVVPERSRTGENSARLAQTSIGQNDVAATPLQMALVAAAVANDGVVMTPHVVTELRAFDGSLYDEIDPEILRVAMSPTTAAVLRNAMQVVAAGHSLRDVPQRSRVAGSPQRALLE